MLSPVPKVFYNFGIFGVTRLLKKHDPKKGFDELPLSLGFVHYLC